VPGQELGTDAIVLPQVCVPPDQTDPTFELLCVGPTIVLPAQSFGSTPPVPGESVDAPPVVVMPLCEWVQSQQWGDPACRSPSHYDGPHIATVPTMTVFAKLHIEPGGYVDPHAAN